MSLTTIVGALLAVVARPKQERIKEEREIERLRRSHARLADHVERLERELGLAQQLLAHWRGEAARLARENRDWREQGSQELYARGHSALQREMISQQAQNAQLAGCAQQQAQHLNQQVGAYQQFEGFCNCVPSRAQVWGAQHGLVQQLNDNTVKE